MKCSIYRIHKDVSLPTKNSPSDAGWDVYNPVDTYLEAGVPTLLPLGLIVRAPEGYHWKLVLRSSAAYKRGLRLLNSVGIIDSSYCGETDELKALVLYDKDHAARSLDTVRSNKVEYLFLKKDERVCQLLLEKNEVVEWVEERYKDFSGNSRGGIGSSGI